jgi:RNA polymerase subunit RPABC4/transcription elongation factor Spt4
MQKLMEPECLNCVADPSDQMCRECNSQTKNWELYRLNLERQQKMRDLLK